MFGQPYDDCSMANGHKCQLNHVCRKNKWRILVDSKMLIVQLHMTMTVDIGILHLTFVDGLIYIIASI